MVLVTEAEPIDVADGGPRVLYVNPGFTKMTGYEPHEIVGLTPRILQSPRTDRAELDRLRTALRRWRPIEVELLNVHKDGTEFWVQINLTPVADETGWWTHWVAIQRDVTARKRRELALQALLATSSDLVLALDASGHVTAASPSAQRLLGREPQDLLASAFPSLVHPQDVAVARALVHPAEPLRLGDGATAELRMRHAGGDWRWLRVSAVDAHPERDPGAVTLSCSDITRH